MKLSQFAAALLSLSSLPAVVGMGCGVGVGNAKEMPDQANGAGAAAPHGRSFGAVQNVRGCAQARSMVVERAAAGAGAAAMKAFEKVRSGVGPNGRPFWHGESADGSGATFLYTSDEAVVGSMVDMEEDAVYQFSRDAHGNDVVTVTHSGEFPPELDSVDIPDDPPDSEEDIRSRRLQVQRELAALQQLQVQSQHSRLMAVRRKIGERDSEREGTSRRKLFDDLGGNQDVMVLWTKKAECRNSGLSSDCSLTETTEANMRALIDLAVQETNTAYSLSGISSELRLVSAYRAPYYVESSSSTYSNALYDLEAGDDSLRDADDIDPYYQRYYKGADIVALIIDSSQACGIAFNGPGFNKMFSVTAWSCATGYFSFGHEIAHNQGCKHDRGQENQCSSTDSNFGFRDPQGDFRSILAYNCVSGQCNGGASGACTRVQRFSNTFSTYNGAAIGDAQNNNAQQIENVKATVAAYYPATSCTSHSECDDGDACNGIETCSVFSVCESGTPVPPCDNGIYCDGVETCDPATGQCVAGTAPYCDDGIACNGQEICSNEAETCLDGTPLAGCCGNGVCESGETCTTCPDDCISGTIWATPSCGNNVCEAWANENHDNCPNDCHGTAKGNSKYKCGSGTGYDYVCESEPRCFEGGKSCQSTQPSEDYCCGDTNCKGAPYEDINSCSLDCQPPSPPGPNPVSTEAPTAGPTFGPTTSSPTSGPTDAPATVSPTDSPTFGPTNAPATVSPTDSPTFGPTNAPVTASPTDSPTSGPTDAPVTASPTDSPTSSPTSVPSNSPTSGPTSAPVSLEPTLAPTESTSPTSSAPTLGPTKSPTSSPTVGPTSGPTSTPVTASPTGSPSLSPTDAPSAGPTSGPTSAPVTASPTDSPTSDPTHAPTVGPTSGPTDAPATASPTDSPTSAPTRDCIANGQPCSGNCVTCCSGNSENLGQGRGKICA